MYELVRGPLVWVAFVVFLGGSLCRLIHTALLARREQVVFPVMDLRSGLRSVLHWVLPFGSRNMRLHPVMTLISFAFHLCLLATPLLLMGHAVLWQTSWGVSWWSLPDSVADIMTLVVILCCAFFAVRRLAAPEVRNVSSASDYLLLLLVVSPFLTGFAADQQWFDAELMTTIHIICGALWLMAIPCTRLSHMLWFIFSRSYMGSEFGAVRHARDW